jgi:hypothetical protein
MNMDHTNPRRAFMSIEADLDDAADEVARRKGIPTLQLPESLTGLARSTPVPDRALSAPPEYVTPRAAGRGVLPPENAPQADYSYVKCRCPGYLLDELYMEARRKRVTVNHLILSALKAQGYFIHDKDMIPDGRRIRGSRTQA